MKSAISPRRGLATLLCAAALCAGLCANAAAQSALQPGQTERVFRDAAIDGETGRIYVAVYDRDAIWVFDPSTMQQVFEISVGEGPSALALNASTGVLACVNSMENTVSFVQLNSEAVIGTAAVEAGPVAIEAVQEGFVTVNPFDDSLTLLTPGASSPVLLKEGVPAVPSAVAAAGDLLVVGNRLSPELTLIPLTPGAGIRSIDIGAPAKALAPLDTDRVAVLTGTEVLIAEISSGKVLARAARTGQDLSADDRGLLLLSSNQILRLDDQLNETESFTLSGAAVSVHAARGLVIALNPKNRAWQWANTQGLAMGDRRGAASAAPAAETAVVATAPVKDEPAPATPETPIVEEAQPADVEAQPTVEAPEAAPAISPASTIMPQPVSAEPTPEIAPSAETAAPEAAPAPGDNIRSYPLQTGGIGAPSLIKPSASPLEPLTRRSIVDALQTPTQFGASEGGFNLTQLGETIENAKFDSMTGSADGAKEFQGNVVLQWGNLNLRSEEFRYRDDPFNLYAEGDVLITQESSSFAANSLDYTVPPDVAIEEPTIFEPPMDEESIRQAKIRQGTVETQGAQLIEPTRELSADYIKYNFADSTGTMQNARGRAGIYYYAAKELRILGPTSLEGEEVWVTTCDHNPPHYKIKMKTAVIENGQLTSGTTTRLQLGNANTPFFMPKWQRGGTGGRTWNLDFDSGRTAELGYFLNVGQRYEINPHLGAGPRVYVSEKEGVGLGFDADYDYTDAPTSPLYRSKGEVHTLYTTKDRSYVHAYHRWETENDLVLKMQLEQWSDENFYKDWYYESYRNRTTPRTFANLSYRQDGYIATGTAHLSTHGWINETEKWPEATFHLLERPLTKRLYLTFDTVNGYYHREPNAEDAARSVNVARLTYDFDLWNFLSVTPFIEAEASFYSKERDSDDSSTRLSPTAGVTVQTRFHKTYGGFWNFSHFRHVILPSVTYSYRPESSFDVGEVPRFDALDRVFGRSRLETKLDNVFYGRDAETGEVWQVGRISLYQGNDFWNEERKAEDYEVEIDVRPRPWWGMQLVGERNRTANDLSNLPFDFSVGLTRFLDRVTGLELEGTPFNFNDVFGDTNRVLAQLYYDKTPLGGKYSGRLGFAYTETRDLVFNREILYGMGYRINDNWGVGFEHRYDFEDRELRSQTYELRRSLHCWETAIRFRDRESGFDLDFEFNIKAFPGSRLKF
ncbi:MAG: hypothetical protein HYV27_08450 [Candidatus Hydrogenedentes bacterium]|nr:hypothetical protein [Candidatus Hydrogenedentota bacterium]